LSNAEEEVKHQQEMCSRLHTELTAVAEKCEQQSTEFEELSEKLRVTYLLQLNTSCSNVSTSYNNYSI